MVAHIIVDAATRNEHSLVVLDFLEHLREAFERLTELADPMVHETQMESAGGERVLQLERLLIALDGLVVEIVYSVFGFLSGILLLRQLFGFTLISETL